MNRRFSTFVIALAIVALTTPAFAASRSLVLAAKDGVPALKASTPGPIVVNKANRAQTTYTTRAAFDTAAGGTLPIEGYENGNVPNGGVSGCISPMNSTTNDPACVNPGDILPGHESAAVAPAGSFGLAMAGAGFSGNPTRTVVANYFTDSENLNFDAATRGGCWGGELQSFFSGVSLTISIFDPALVLTGSYTAPGSNAGTFFGVIDDTNDIARVNILDPSGANAEGADNVAWGPQVPVDLQSFEVE
jgi:hypothetical protein